MVPVSALPVTATFVMSGAPEASPIGSGKLSELAVDAETAAPDIESNTAALAATPSRQRRGLIRFLSG